MARCAGSSTVGSVNTGTTPDEPFGIAVIRAWIERGPPRVLKVRVTTAPDAKSAPRTVGVTSNVDDACTFIREWLDRLVGGDPEG